MRKILYAVPILLMVGLTALFYVGLGKDPKLLPSALIGAPAPQFDLPALLVKDQAVSSASIEGRVVLMNFFASWCGPCRIEHPLLMNLAEAGEVPVYGINYKDTEVDAKRWLADFGDPFAEIGADLEGRTGIDWGVYGLPETFLVNQQGQIVYKHVGPLTSEVLNEEIMPLVRELEK